jgi:hypothetical protein
VNVKLQFLRQRIEHENNLINHRLSALVGSQAFLVSGFAVSLNAPVQFHSASYEAVHRLLPQLLPIAGIATIVVMLLSLSGAVLALNGLHKQCSQLETPEDLPVHSSLAIRWLGNAAVVGVPVIFFSLWVTLLVTLL